MVSPNSLFEFYGLRNVLRDFCQKHFDLAPIPGEVVSIHYTAKAFFLLGVHHPLRSLCIKVVYHRVFSYIVLLAVVLNSIFLALQDPSIASSAATDYKYAIDVLDLVFLAIFGVEMVLKMIALGVILHRKSYLRSSWNILDFVVVVTGAIDTFSTSIGGVSVLRVLRVLRPLRTVSKIQSLKRILSKFIRSIPRIGDVFALLLFVLWLMAILGIHLFRGSLHGRCYADVGPEGTGYLRWQFPDLHDFNRSTGTARNASANDALVSLPANLALPAGFAAVPASAAGRWLWRVENDTHVCSAAADLGPQGRHCGADTNGVVLPQRCLAAADTTTHTLLNFDNLYTSILLSFRIVCKDNWPATYVALAEANGIDVFPFFFVTTLFAGYFCVNLFIAVLSNAFSSKSSEDYIDSRPVANTFASVIGAKAVTDSLLLSGFYKAPLRLYAGTERRRQQIIAATAPASSSARHRSPFGDMDSSGLDESRNATRPSSAPVSPFDVAPDGGGSDASSTRSERSHHVEAAAAAIEAEDKVVRTLARALWERAAACTGVPIVAKLVHHKAYTTLLILAVLVNSVIMSLDRTDASAAEERVIEEANIVFNFIFFADAGIKLVGLGTSYFFSGMNVMDFALCIASIPDVISGNASAFGVLRSFRLLRLLRVAGRWRSLQRLLDLVVESVRSVGSVALIAAIVIYVYAVLGFQLFGIAMPGMRYRFDSIPDSILAVFVIVTGEDWSDMMQAIAAAKGHWSVLYFVSLVVFGNFILTNLFIAIVLESFGNGLDDDAVEEVPASRNGETCEAVRRVTKEQYLREQEQLDFREVQRRVSVHALSPMREPSDTTDPSASFRSPLAPDGAMGGDDNPDAALPTAVRPVLETLAEEVIVQHAAAPDEDNVPPTAGGDLGNWSLEPIGRQRPKLRGGPIVLESFDIHSDDDVASRSQSLSGSGTQLTTAQRRDVDRHVRGLEDAAHTRLPKGSHAILRQFVEEHPEYAHGHVTASGTAFAARAATEITSSNAARVALIVQRRRERELRKYKADAYLAAQSRNARSGLRPTLRRRKSAWLDEGPLQVATFDRHFVLKMTVAERESHRKQWAGLAETSMGCFAPTMPLRVRVGAVLQARLTEWALVAITMFSSITLALDHSRANDGSTGLEALIDSTDILFSVLFAVEAVVKCFALGVARHRGAYFRSVWNIIDFVVLVTSVAAHFYRPLKAFRALRVFRFLNLSFTMRVITTSLASAVPSMGSVAVLCLFFFWIFSVLGVGLFKGRFGACSDTSVFLKAECTGTFNQTFVTAFGEGYAAVTRRWGPVEPTSTYDNVAKGLYSLLKLSLSDGWFSQMYTAIDSTGTDSGPLLNSRPEYGVFFVVFMLIGNFFAVNLFVGVLVDRFVTHRRRRDGTSLLTDSQLQWIIMQKVMLRTAITVPPSPPDNKLRRWCFNVAEHRFFDMFFSAVIVLSSIVLSVYFYDMPATMEEALDLASYVILALFTVEILVKLMAYGVVVFWRNLWNRLDFVVVALSWAGYLIGGNAEVVRVLRVARLILLLREMKGLQTLFMTLFQALPELINVGVVLCVFYFVYAIVCTQLFSGIPHNGVGINDYVNFDNVSNSLITLYVMMTTETWSLVVDGLTDPPCPADNPDCGSYAAIPLMILYMTMMSWVLSNLLVTVVVDGFSEAERTEGQEANLKIMEDFRTEWMRHDAVAARVLPAAIVVRILATLPNSVWERLVTAANGEHAVRPWVLMLRQLEKMHIPIDHKALVRYEDCMASITMRLFGIPTRSGIEVSQRTSYGVTWSPRHFSIHHYYAARRISQFMRLQRQRRREAAMRADVQHYLETALLREEHDVEPMRRAYAEAVAYMSWATARLAAGGGAGKVAGENHEPFADNFTSVLPPPPRPRTVSPLEPPTAAPRREAKDLLSPHWRPQASPAAGEHSGGLVASETEQDDDMPAVAPTPRRRARSPDRRLIQSIQLMGREFSVPTFVQSVGDFSSGRTSRASSVSEAESGTHRDDEQ